MRREIKAGETVYCAGYRAEDREACWINGRVVSEVRFVEDERGRAHVEGEKFSHLVSHLRHEDEPPNTIDEE